MKLELKHLAPYLPYGLKLLRFDGKSINLTEKFYNIPTAILQNYSPILRPLSELENINIFTKKYYVSHDNTEGFKIKRKNETYTRLNELEYLYMYHFDVFNLIEKGLAIDINNINKQL